MERPAMVNRSMPSIAGATISIPPARAVYGVFQREVPSLDEEHNLQRSREVYQMESGFPRHVHTSAHSYHLKTGSCSHSVEPACLHSSPENAKVTPPIFSSYNTRNVFYGLGGSPPTIFSSSDTINPARVPANHHCPGFDAR